jgi:hypothetical protein
MRHSKNYIRNRKNGIAAICLLLSLFSCSENPQSIKKQNVKGESVFRSHLTHLFIPPPPRPKQKAPYPWQERFLGKYPRISKEFFRCKGNPANPVIVKKNDEKKDAVYYRDCGGCERHGLPLRDGKEFVYPCLIDLLNYCQEKTGKKVVITTGHRCRDHNTYCDPTPANFGSKHMMGAEVDFYIEGMQQQTETLISVIQQYYAEKEPYKGHKEYEKFERYQKEGMNVSTPPWFNKEIFVKLYSATEGRDIDNQHPYPYLSIQVRYDRERDQKVSYDDVAAKNYLRY